MQHLKADRADKMQKLQKNKKFVRGPPAKQNLDQPVVNIRVNNNQACTKPSSGAF